MAIERSILFVLCISLMVGCQRGKSTAQYFENTKFPVVGADALMERALTLKDGRPAHGVIISNCFLISNLTQLSEVRPKVILIPEDILVWELITNEISLQDVDSDRAHRSLVFCRYERFAIVALDQSMQITDVTQKHYQNVKIIVARNDIFQ